MQLLELRKKWRHLENKYKRADMQRTILINKIEILYNCVYNNPSSVYLDNEIATFQALQKKYEEYMTKNRLERNILTDEINNLVRNEQEGRSVLILNLNYYYI